MIIWVLSLDTPLTYPVIGDHTSKSMLVALFQIGRQYRINLETPKFIGRDIVSI